MEGIKFADEEEKAEEAAEEEDKEVKKADEINTKTEDKGDEKTQEAEKVGGEIEGDQEEKDKGKAVDPVTASAEITAQWAQAFYCPPLLIIVFQ